MKKMILSIAMVMTLGMIGKAQTAASPAAANQQQNRPVKSPDERAQKDADRAEKKLGLSADQKTKWRAASLERINANEPLKAQMKAAATAADKQSAASRLRANMQKFDDTINGFLTADQKTKWEQEKQQRKNMRKGNRRGAANGDMAPGN